MFRLDHSTIGVLRAAAIILPALALQHRPGIEEYRRRDRDSKVHSYLFAIALVNTID